MVAEIDTMYVLHVNPITSSKWEGSKVPVNSNPVHEADEEAKVGRKYDDTMV